uniref:Transposase Tc1-like domain-containing protein n=1 Tax=Electrophorus electricus TaxID=8005 RepID=A0AAY5E8V0_ELEEL
KEVQKIIGCSAKMISNALKWQTKPETRGRKRNTTICLDHKITRMANKNPRKVPLLKTRRKWRNILWTDESKILLIGFKGHRQHHGPV